MVFQANKWSWKRIAARLLLVPVLAGGSAATAQQKSALGAAPTKTAAGPVMTAASGGEPKAMLKEGRKALTEGRYNDAQDLARRAEASNVTGKWGLFDDTPNALLKDVQAAVLKAQKAEADQLAKQAKALFAKPTSSDAEKAANLDTALKMARRADSLHGSYSAWDLSDRPDKMVKDIEAARTRLKVAAAPMMVAGVPGGSGVRPAVDTSMPNAPSGVVPAGGIKPPITSGPLSPTSANVKPAASGDAKKIAAVKLVAEGKQLSNKGDFGGAHAKFTEAQKLNATFAANETGPGFALQELNARGASAIDGLIKDAQSMMGKKDYAKADAALNAAYEIATALNLFPRPIEEAKTALRMATDGKFGGASASTGPVLGSERLVASVPPPVAPVAPPGLASIGNPMAPLPPDKQLTDVPPIAMPTVGKTGTASTGKISGQEMLDQASLEFRKGDFEMASRLARQAYNLGGVQKEATGLLNQIDAEVFATKQRNAVKSFEAAEAACKSHDHGHALSVLIIIDPNLLTTELKSKRDELIVSCKAEVDKLSVKPDMPLVATGGTQPPMEGALQPIPGVNLPGTARVGEGKNTNPDSLANQADAMRKVTFQKLRGDGLKVQTDSQAAFGRGETDVAIQMLIDYTNKVRGAGLDTASVAMLLRPIDSRMEMFKVMKGQADAMSRINRENRDSKELVASRGGAADEQRKAEVVKLVRQYQDLVKKSDFAAAERVAMQAKQLEPDDAAIGTLAYMAKVKRRQQDVEKIKSDKEDFFVRGLNNAEREGPTVDTQDPVAFEIKRTMQSRLRGRGDDAYLRSRTPAEFQIELNLDKPITVEFNQTPLSEVVESLREKTQLPFSWDTASLTAEQVSTALPITEKLGSVSARNALHLILDKAGLSFVIEYDTIRITTLKKAKGRLVTKVFSVADLVTPIPNFALPDYANFDKLISKTGKAPSGFYPGGGALLPTNGGLGGGTPAGPLGGAQLGTSGVGVGGGSGSLQNNPLNPSSNLASDSGTKHEQLMKLVTGMVRPFSWDGQGGPGRIEYFNIGMALVVNQTADVIREVQDLLEALRRLQDLAVAVEVRIISLSETWFERMGVDFSVNVKTHTTKFEPALTSGQFRPEPFINDINNKGVVAGISPAGNFTPDLDVPIRATSFNYAIPGFGGFPNTPGANGGVSLGLAFLNDIQVYMFMEAAQGDRRVNVMQAPKLTLFNGQTATITINELQFFVTDVQVYSVNGQIVFIPQVTPLPGPGDPLGGTGGAINISLQAVVSADRRFVRINLPVTLAAQTGATVPLFPITTFITPVFEGGSQGVPIPFTQFLQQPAFTTLNIQTTVVCPDGGTVLLGGLKKLSEGRNEFGPPFLSKIPYLNRLFKNVGIGRETQHIMIMVTPRIIINSEEEINQTEGGPLGSGGPGR